MFLLLLLALVLPAQFVSLGLLLLPLTLILLAQHAPGMSQCLPSLHRPDA